MKKITQGLKKRQPKIKTEMTGKGLTVHGGLLPVLSFMDKLYFFKAVETALHKQRGANARYQFADAVQMIVIGVMTGATAMTQVAAVWADDVLRRMAGYGETPVDTTLGRIMKEASYRDVTAMEGLIHRFRTKVWKRAVRTGTCLKSAMSVMWLDVDSTVDGVFGKQEGAAKGYNPGKKGQESYHPLMAFVSETKEVLHSWFRTGSAYTSNGAVEFMKECMARIKKGVKVIVRADSGFFDGSLLDYLESTCSGYLIKVKLKNLNALLERQIWKAIDSKNLPGWEQTEFEYKCITWSKSRKFVAVRQLVGIEKGLIELRKYQSFCYVTTEILTPYAAHKKYGERATCETWIEECKTQMNAGHIRTSEFWANSALFQSAILAYNLLKWMALLTGGAVRKWEIKTMRLWLIRVAGKLTKDGGQLILKLPKKFLHQEEWQLWERMSLNVF